MVWFRRRRAKSQRKRLEVLAELHARESVREAEEILARAWAGQLNNAARAYPRQVESVEYQQLRLIRAARKRAKAAEQDRRLLIELGEDPDEVVPTNPPVRNPRAQGPGEDGLAGDS